MPVLSRGNCPCMRRGHGYHSDCVGRSETAPNAGGRDAGRFHLHRGGKHSRSLFHAPRRETRENRVLRREARAGGRPCREAQGARHFGGDSRGPRGHLRCARVCLKGVLRFKRRSHGPRLGADVGPAGAASLFRLQGRAVGRGGRYPRVLRRGHAYAKSREAIWFGRSLRTTHGSRRSSPLSPTARASA